MKRFAIRLHLTINGRQYAAHLAEADADQFLAAVAKAITEAKEDLAESRDVETPHSTISAYGGHIPGDLQLLHEHTAGDRCACCGLEWAAVKAATDKTCHPRV